MKYLNELKHGETYLFMTGNRYYVGRAYESSKGFYMCQNQLNGAQGADCPDRFGFRFSWFIGKDEVKSYFVCKDEAIEAALIDIDKDIAHLYKNSESVISEYDAKSKLASASLVKEALDLRIQTLKEQIVEMESIETANNSADGINADVEKQRKATDARYEKSIAAWHPKNQKETKE